MVGVVDGHHLQFRDLQTIEHNSQCGKRNIYASDGPLKRVENLDLILISPLEQTKVL